MAGMSSFFRTAVAFSVSFASSAGLRTISEQTARKLVLEALASGESRQPFHVEPGVDYWAPEFYTFDAWRSDPNLRDGEVGVLITRYLSVNPWNGDVWDRIACKRITSPAIEKEQESIWQRSRLPTEAREPLHWRSPCLAGEERMGAGKPLGHH